MTSVPTGVRPPNRTLINMMGRARGGADEGDEREDAGGEEQADAAGAQGEAEDDVAGLFGDFETEDEGEQEQPQRRVRQRRAPAGGDEGRDQAQEEEGDREEVPPPPNIHLPIAPSQEDWDEHFRTHINFRDWCPVCVEARGRERPHHRRRDAVRSGLPTICMDYKEVRKGRPPLIIVKDQATKSTFCHQALRKGGSDQWLVKRVIRDIENTGHTAVTLKGDGEPAMQDFLRAVKEQRNQPANIEEPPGNDPQSNGVAEKSVQDAMGQVRTLKLGLEYRLGHAIDDNHAIVEWMIEHAGWLITHLRVGADGRTAWQRVTGRVCTQPLVEFGEVVWAKPLRRSAGNRHKVNLEARWF